MNFRHFLLLIAFLPTACESWRFAAPADDLSIRTPGTWQAVSTGSEGAISSGWLSEFRDADLTRTVDQALAHNRDLKAAAARLREAGETTIIARSRMLPSVGLSGSSSVTDSSSGAPSSRSHGLNLAAAWEPDLWGRLRDLTRAAEAEERAAIEDFRGARLSLAANAAKAWCNLISAEQEVTLAKVTLESFEKNLRIIERNYRGTGEGALDIQFGRTNVSGARRTVESRLLERDEAARSLEILLGRYPSGTTRSEKDLPKLAGHVPAGLPADLVERRPDLAAARARLFASAQRADAARKALLPSFSITGSGGNSNARLAELLDWQNLTATLVGRFTQVITEGGAVSAEARVALARNEALLHGYAQTALTAFREVEAALAADRSLAEQEKFLASEMEQAVLAERQAERDYAEGINPNILSVLEAQRRANNARASMIRLRNQRLQNRIDLHLALGGDFRTRPK
ncbi:MAG TPA: efflux transporter outer membrane subunit [Luteolibacter sp.]|nr:efflux transporter outer membrane subunit [Luteolibacter sp.]